LNEPLGRVSDGDCDLGRHITVWDGATAAKVFRIGVLSPAASPSTKAFDAFRDGLRELDYIDGSNIMI